MKVIFTERAKKDWEKLERPVQDQLRKKLSFYLKNPDPLKFADHLKDHAAGSFRFRAGDYRIIFDCDKKGEAMFILRVGHRKDIYR